MSSADSLLPRLGLLRNSAGGAAHLVEALVEIGARPVFEVSSSELSAASFADGDVEVVVVGLDDDSDLAALESLGSIRAVFDDLAASNGLSGWDRARWLRHLRAKILGTEVEAPPRPEGAQYIPVRALDSATAAIPKVDEARHLARYASSGGPPAPAHGADTGVAVSGSALDSHVETAQAVDGDSLDGARSIADWDPEALPGSDGPGTSAQSESAEGLEFESDWNWTEEVVATPVGDEPSHEAIPDAVGIDEPAAPDRSIDPNELEYQFSELIVSDSDSTDWLEPPATPERRVAEQEAVTGLDELLDALRRDKAEAEPVVRARPDPRETPVAINESPAPSPLSFDLSNLTLEPLEHERPLTGRAQFELEPEPPVEQSPPQARTESHGAAVAERGSASTPTEPTSAWLLAAGEAEVERVTAFLDLLPATLSALVLLVRPASAPWMGASLAFEESGRLPLILGDEVMDVVGGRVVVMAPGERAGFNRSGQLTVQPGDYSLPEALGDWMSMRALAGRFGRDAGVIVFGRLRDEILEGAIELARAGGQVWFESSVYEQPNETVEAARAAGIAMRSGSSSELAGALIEFLRR